MPEQQDERLPLNELLMHARQQKQWSLEEVAQRLNLPVSQLEKFEQTALNPVQMGPFERGYLRNYARVLEIDEQQFADYLPNSDQISSQLKSMQRFHYGTPKPLFSGRKMRFLMGLVFLGLLVWLVWSLMD
jgi:cytoskeleton protein RodZ